MKKIIFLSSLFGFSIMFMSCQKETVEDLTTFSNPNKVEPKQPITIISNWFTMSFDQISNRGETYLQGIEAFTNRTDNDYDRTMQVELGYVAMYGIQRVPVIKRLPMRLEDPSLQTRDIFSFTYIIDHRGFVLTVKNTDPLARTPNAVDFVDFKYRYLVIPRAQYENMSIDWDNYNEVARALNL